MRDKKRAIFCALERTHTDADIDAMTRKNAAGPKTDTPPHLPPPNRTVDELNTQLALMTDAIRICLSRAVTDEDADDASSRDAELDNAVKLAEVSAHLTQAAARLKGEFQHRYKIIRVNGREAAQMARNDAWPQGLSEDEAANLSDEEILQRMLAGCPPKG